MLGLFLSNEVKMPCIAREQTAHHMWVDILHASRVHADCQNAGGCPQNADGPYMVVQAYMGCLQLFNTQLGSKKRARTRLVTVCGRSSVHRHGYARQAVMTCCWGAGGSAPNGDSAALVVARGELTACSRKGYASCSSVLGIVISLKAIQYHWLGKHPWAPGVWGKLTSQDTCPLP